MAKKKKEEEVTLIQALDLVIEEKGIDRNTVIDSLKEAIEKSYKKIYDRSEAVLRVEIDEVKSKIRVFEIKTVVDDVMDEDFELSIEEAQEIKPDAQVGDEIVTEIDPSQFSRLAAMQVKQLLRQKNREAEKEALYNEFIDKKDDIITGIVDRVEERFVIIKIGKTGTGALLPLNQQIPGEKLVEGQKIKVYVSDVEKTTKGTHIGVSRTEAGLVKRLFELEVPEIFEGIVEIKSVSREAGDRSKIAVYTSDSSIDAIGSCVGQKGSRVRKVCDEINGEMIDIIEWNEDPVVFISNALSPSDVLYVEINEEKHSALVIVPDNQLSLAIGKKGQNARLAVHLTGWKIDIKSESDAKKENIDYTKKEVNEEVHEDVSLFKEFIDKPVEEQEEIIEEIAEEDVAEETFDEPAEEIDDGDEYFDEDEEYDYDPKYDEEIDYDEFDKYYDEK